VNLLIDTNIILYITRNPKGIDFLKKLNPDEKLVYVSFVSIAEAHSIAYQNRWGSNKAQRLEEFFSSVRVVSTDHLLLPTYIGIDAYSQRTHPNYQKYPFSTPRNMGKNDLWKAATASLLNLQLVTTDEDFDHLETSFLSLRKISQTEIQKHFKN
jgi:tRNA(fMet)-specific endonuclease VapC